MCCLRASATAELWVAPYLEIGISTDGHSSLFHRRSGLQPILAGPVLRWARTGVPTGMSWSTSMARLHQMILLIGCSNASLRPLGERLRPLGRAERFPPESACPA